MIAPAYPGFEVEVEALRTDPAPIERVSVQDTLEHLEGIISGLESPPILIGHSFGGALVQILLDRGLAAAGIAIDSVPTEGVRTLPASQIRATFPVVHNPATTDTPRSGKPSPAAQVSDRRSCHRGQCRGAPASFARTSASFGGRNSLCSGMRR